VAAASAAAARLSDLLRACMNGRLDLTPAAVDAIKALAPDSADGRETGGILIGRGPDPAGLIVIDEAGDAGPAAIRRPDFFLRDRAHAERLAQTAWADREGVWVGDWHTHPLGGPQPSERDLRTYAGLLAAAELEFRVFVSIIVVPDQEAGWREPHLYPWLFESAGKPTTRSANPDAS
jgi:integrative and conjugative element protein (TIGR02256 family)